MQPLQQAKPNSMATASLILGGLAFFLALSPGYSLFCGCLSILFAILSRGSGLKMPDKAIIGLITSTIAIIITGLLFFAALYLQQYLIQKFGADALKDPQTLQNLILEQFDQFLNQLRTGGGGL